MAQSPYRFEKTLTRHIEVDYLLHLPLDYTNQMAWPFILFLHGSGERGSDLNDVSRFCLPKRLELVAHDLPFVVISPQCPEGRIWDDIHHELIALTEHAVENYRVDPRRIYVTGFSMGGRGVWKLAALYPDHFAAGVPIAAPADWYVGDPLKAVEPVANTPMWVFHGEDDPIVPYEHGERMATALHQVGGQVRLTKLNGVGHAACDPVYAMDGLYEWFLSHQRDSAE